MKTAVALPAAAKKPHSTFGPRGIDCREEKPGSFFCAFYRCETKKNQSTEKMLRAMLRAMAIRAGARDENFCDFILLLGITAVKLISGGDHMATAKKAAKKSTKKASAKKGKKK